MALRESEKKFSEPLIRQPIGAAMVDLNFSFVRVNKVMSDDYGLYRRGTLIQEDTRYNPSGGRFCRGRLLQTRLSQGEIDFYENDTAFYS